MSRFQPTLKSVGLGRVWHGILANGEELKYKLGYPQINEIGGNQTWVSGLTSRYYRRKLIQRAFRICDIGGVPLKKSMKNCLKDRLILTIFNDFENCLFSGPFCVLMR